MNPIETSVNVIFPASVKNLTYVMAAFIGVSTDMVGALAFLMIVDFFTGIAASYRCEGGRAITSRRALHGIASKMLLVFIPVSIAATGHGAQMDLLWMVNSFFMVMSFSELYSIVGNAYTFKTGKRVPEYDAISVILNEIRTILDRLPGKA